MSRDKQIDIPESEMGMSGYSKFSWKLWEEGLCNMSEAQRADQIMREQGYRKSTNLAEEIFAEIDKLLAVDSNGEANLDVRALQRLKKKYTESKGE